MIERLTVAERTQAVEVLAAVFHDCPVMRFVLHDAGNVYEERLRALLGTPDLPPARVIGAVLVNELDELGRGPGHRAGRLPRDPVARRLASTCFLIMNGRPLAVPGSSRVGQPAVLEVHVQDLLIFPALLLLLIWMLFRSFTRAIRDMARSPELRMLLLSVVALLAGGTYVFRRVERWDVLDSLYYCVITLTTVGYGDVTPQTELGKIVAIVYILLGIGVIMAFATTVAQIALTHATKAQNARFDSRGHGQDR